MGVASLKDYQSVEWQVVDIPYVASSTLSSYVGATCGLDASGENVVCAYDGTASNYIFVLDKYSLAPIGYQVTGGYAALEVSPNVLWVPDTTSTPHYLKNLSKHQTMTLDTASVTPAVGNLAYNSAVGSRTIAQAMARNYAQNNKPRRFSHARNRIIPPTVNNTYPYVADPGTCATAGFVDNGVTGSGGALAATETRLKFAWITKTNTSRTKYGLTLPTTDYLSRTPTLNDAWNITLPALPTNVVGTAVFATVDGTNYYLIGATNATGASAFVLKATYNQLAATGAAFSGKGGMDKMVFLGASAVGTIVDCYDFNAPASAIPAAVSLSSLTADNYPQHVVWSPWQLDTSYLHRLLRLSTTVGTLSNIDKVSLVGMANSLNQTPVPGTGGLPYYKLTQVNSAVDFVFPVPELAAYAVYCHSGGNGPAWIELRSYITGELLWSMALPLPYNTYLLGGYGYQMCPVDFQELDGQVFLLYNMPINRQIARIPIRIRA